MSASDKVVSDPLAFLTQPVDLIVTGRLPDVRLPDTQLGQKPWLS